VSRKHLIAKLKRLRQIRYDAPTKSGEVEKLMPRHLLEEVIAELSRPWWWPRTRTLGAVKNLKTLAISTKGGGDE
jgi:hypothetical protein